MLCLLTRSDLAFCVVRLVPYSETSMLKEMWPLYSGVKRKCGNMFFFRKMLLGLYMSI
jgi:N-acyl-L-homoserine lactone synthetase